MAVVHGLALPVAEMADGDSWLRLLRVRRLLDGAGWFDVALPGLDAPFGSTSHWTRPLDLLILILVLPLRIGLDLPDALHWAGLLVSPVLHAASALVLAWGLVPLCGRVGGLLGAVLTLTQPAILAYGGPGHADHHILFLLVTAALLGFLLRGLGGRPGHLLLAGGMAALGVWVSVEMLLVLGLVLTVLGLAWVMGADRGAQGNRLFARGLAWGLIAALVLERPGADWLSVEYDRFSVVHVVFGGLVLTFWTLAGRRWEDGSWKKRLAVAILGAGAIAALLRAAFPGILKGPAADVPPDLWALLAGQIAEYQGLHDPATFLVVAGGTLIALPWVAWRLGRGSRGGKRLAWGLVLLSLLVFLPLSLAWMRWSVNWNCSLPSPWPTCWSPETAGSTGPCRQAAKERLPRWGSRRRWSWRHWWRGLPSTKKKKLSSRDPTAGSRPWRPSWRRPLGRTVAGSFWHRPISGPNWPIAPAIGRWPGCTIGPRGDCGIACGSFRPGMKP